MPSTANRRLVVSVWPSAATVWKPRLLVSRIMKESGSVASGLVSVVFVPPGSMLTVPI